MWLSHEDARSDFVLTVAAAVLGRFAVGLLTRLPGYPGGLIAAILDIGWVALILGAPAYLLARYRRDVPDAFGLGPKERGPVLPGVVVASPLVLAHLVPIALEGDLGAMVRGLLGRLLLAGPSITESLLTVDSVVVIVRVLVVAAASWLFVSFLVVRSRDAFRSPDMDVTEALRTFGMGAIGATFLLGLLRALAGFGFVNTLLATLTLLVVLLVVDQYVPARLTTTRATVIGPTIAVVVLWVLAAGGLFRGNLLLGLHQGAAAAVITICAAALIEARKGWSAGLLVVAAVIYPVAELTLPLPF